MILSLRCVHPGIGTHWIRNDACVRAGLDHLVPSMPERPVPQKCLPDDEVKLLQDALAGDFTSKLEAAALVIQILLVDSRGDVVASPLAYEVQMRLFSSGDRAQRSDFRKFELSRRSILKNTADGGLKDFSAVPSWLSGAGNEYGFAPPVAGHSIAVNLASACSHCQGPGAGQLFTFAGKADSASPPVRKLSRSDA
jgi:hypothetical protein